MRRISLFGWITFGVGLFLATVACRLPAPSATPGDTSAAPQPTASSVAPSSPSPASPSPTATPLPGHLSGQGPYTLSTDDGLALTLSSTGQALVLTLDGEPLPIQPGPVVWVRDMSHAAEVRTPNLLTNPGFEEGLSHWQTLKAQHVQISLAPDPTHEGAQALQMTGTDAQLGVAAVIGAPIPVTTGQRYRISGYFLASRGYVQGPSGTPPFRQDKMWRGVTRPSGLYVRFLDARGQAVGALTLVAPLHWNAHTWRPISGEVRIPEGVSQMQVVVGGRLEKDETLWVDDLAVVASPEQETSLTGSVTPCPDEVACLQQTIPWEENGLTLTVTYRAWSNRLAIQVNVQDTSGQDRALEVVWGLPLDLTPAEGTSWFWWDDVRHRRPIQAGDVAVAPEEPFSPALSWAYEHVVSGVWDGWLPVSLYPYALVEDGHHGLALGVDLSQPNLVKLAYDQTLGRYEARSYLGISPLATKIGPQADFGLELYRMEPTWGFRAAMAAFAQHHPDWFTSPRSLSEFVGFERGCYIGTPGAQRVKQNDAAHIFTAEYLAAEGYINLGNSKDVPRPSYEQAVEQVTQLATSSRAVDRACAQAITQSVAIGTNGDWQLKHLDVFYWTGGRWQAVWFTNLDPDIPQGWGTYLWEWDVLKALEVTQKSGAVLDGILMDNFMTAPGVDLSPEHIAVTDFPLVYDVNTYRPGVHNMAPMHEFFTYLRRQWHELGRDDMVISINFWGLATPNPLVPLIDAFGGEGDTHGEASTNWESRVLDYRRAMAYGRPQAWSNGARDLNADQARAFVARALFYGIFPNRKEEATGWTPEAEAVLEQAQALHHRFALTGWEPLTYAVSEKPEVWVERFGGQGQPLFFTVYNPGEAPQTTVLVIQTAPLGLEAERVQVSDLATGETLPVQVDAEGNLRVSLSLPGQQTVVLRVGN